MRIALTGGGTGGHIFPLIAVVIELKRLVADVEIRYIGPTDFGADLLREKGVTVRGILAGKIPRYATPRILVEFVKMPLGFLQSFFEIYRYMPDIVFGKGGYGMVSTALAARLFRIPVVIHESDAVAGLATRLVARFVNVVLLSFPTTEGIDVADARVVGNPVRQTLMKGEPVRAQKRFHLSMNRIVLILGGSQGADELNAIMLQIAPELVRDVEVIHQAGTRHAKAFAGAIESILEHHPESRGFYHVVPFLDEEALADAYTVATVVVSRAGAGSVFELALVGAPTIFIPITGSAANHQYRNVEALAKDGAAILLAGDKLSPHLLLAKIRTLLGDKEERRAMTEKFRAFAKPDAAFDIARVLMEVLNSA